MTLRETATLRGCATCLSLAFPCECVLDKMREQGIAKTLFEHGIDREKYLQAENFITVDVDTVAVAETVMLNADLLKSNRRLGELNDLRKKVQHSRADSVDIILESLGEIMTHIPAPHRAKFGVALRMLVSLAAQLRSDGND